MWYVIAFVVIAVVAYLFIRAKKLGIDSGAKAEAYAKEHLDVYEKQFEDFSKSAENKARDYFSHRPVTAAPVNPTPPPATPTPLPVDAAPSPATPTPLPTESPTPFPVDPNAPRFGPI